MIIFDSVVVRARAGFTQLTMVVVIIAAHLDLLHIPEIYKDTISLLALVIVGMNNPGISMMKDRGQDVEKK